jgi:hypothetical protein
MGYPKVYVDGILLNWADRLFPLTNKRPVGARGMSPAMLYLAAISGGGKAGRVRAQADRTARKVPEVMVKVTNKKGAGRGMAAIREHLDYISRNAKLEIEDQNREIYDDRQALRQLKESWQLSGRRLIPETAQEGRGLDAVNLMFSMQPGTPPEVVKDSVRDLLQEEFAGREYLFVLHTDKAHPHVHVCLKTEATHDLPRLRHGRKELQRWREAFAENLRQRGVEANATPRPTRGQPMFPVPLHQYHRDRKNPRRRPPTPPVPAQCFRPQREAWRAMAQALNQSNHAGDVGLARRIVAFWRNTPVGAVPTVSQSPSPSSTEPQLGNHERLERARITAARLFHPPLFESDPGHPAARREIEPLSRLRHVSSSDLVQDRKDPELLLQPNARGHVER